MKKIQGYNDYWNKSQVASVVNRNGRIGFYWSS